LAEPEVPLAGEQAVAEDRGDVPEEERVFVEALVADRHHLFDEVGAAHHEPRPAAQAHRHDVPVVAGARGQEAEDVLPELREVPDEEMAGRARRPRRHACRYRSCRTLRWWRSWPAT